MKRLSTCFIKDLEFMKPHIIMYMALIISWIRKNRLSSKARLRRESKLSFRISKLNAHNESKFSESNIPSTVLRSIAK